MKLNNLGRFLTSAALATVFAFAVAIQAAEKTPSAGAAKPATPDKKSTHYPIHGKLSAVDRTAKTFTLKGAQKDHVFKVNAETKITRHGKPATLADAVVGEDVGGYVEKLPDGSVLALSVRFGPKPDDGAHDARPPTEDVPANSSKKQPPKK